MWELFMSSKSSCLNMGLVSCVEQRSSWRGESIKSDRKTGHYQFARLHRFIDAQMRMERRHLFRNIVNLSVLALIFGPSSSASRFLRSDRASLDDICCPTELTSNLRFGPLWRNQQQTAFLYETDVYKQQIREYSCLYPLSAANPNLSSDARCQGGSCHQKVTSHHVLAVDLHVGPRHNLRVEQIQVLSGCQFVLNA